MSHYDTLSDDYYLNLNLNTEMDLPQGRETVLHFFEQVQKRYPTMKNFYTRERGEFVLEEDKEGGNYRWTSVELRRICAGQVNPNSIEDAVEQHRMILDHAPFSLSVSPLDCESLNIMFGFDFTYRGNHNKLLAEALGISPAMESFTQFPRAAIVCNEPAIQLALDEDCRIQCRLSMETRTSAYHVKTGEYPEEQLSVYLTVRRYGSLEKGENFVSTMENLVSKGQELIESCVAEQILRPLQETIAIL
jgi:hypothetical protein